jgi:DNA-binding MarR family transcriptional regulator
MCGVGEPSAILHTPTSWRVDILLAVCDHPVTVGLIEDLSAAFVAFVIEVDDAVEARRPTGKGPWLTSVAMWRNCMQWVPADGITVAELFATARTPTNLHGMRRWRYVEVEGWVRSASGRPPLKAVVRPTRRGAEVAAAWDPIPAEVEERWDDRYGSPVAELRAVLVDLAEELDAGLPDTMPIVGYGWATRRDGESERRPGPVPIAALGLDSLLARALTAFALEYEATGKLSLALSANLLAVLDTEPTPLRRLPDATGIQREQIDNAAGYLVRAGLAELVPIPGAKRGKALALTERGEKAKAASASKLTRLEATWEERHAPILERARDALASLLATSAAEPTADRSASPMLAGLTHPPGTWRAEAKELARLPRFPLVTHRGGFPDGA